MSRAANPDRQAGFSLVELLIVVAVSGLLTALAATSLKAVVLGWQHVTASDSSRDSCVAVRDFLRRLLSEAYPAVIEAADRSKAVDFDGAVDHVDFLAPLLQRFGAADIVWYRLYSRPDQTLHLAWRLDRAGGDGFPHDLDADSVIAIHTANLSFSFFGNEDPNDEPTWRNSWRGSQSLPKLVRIQMNNCADTKYGDLVISLKLTEAGCTNQASGSCSNL